MEKHLICGSKGSLYTIVGSLSQQQYKDKDLCDERFICGVVVITSAL